MSLLQRYVIVETIKVLLIALVGTSSVLILGGGLRESIRQGLPMLVALRTIPFLLPEMLRLTVPASLLFAICTVFSRMSASEELTAMKSLGLSPMQVIVPVLGLAGGLSIATCGLYDLCAIWSRPNLYALAVNCVDDVAYNALRNDSVFKTSGVTVSVNDVVERRLIEPRVEIAGDDERPPMFLRAREATLAAIPDTGRLRIRLLDSQIKIPGKVAITYPNEFDHEMQIRPTRSTDESDLSPAELKSTSLPSQIEQEEMRVAELKRLVDLGRTARQPEYEHRRERFHRLQAEFQRRIANGFAVLAFAMIGVPIAIRWKSADNMSIFFACFLPIALLYYPLLTIGESMARNGIYPKLTVWLAPTVLMAAGIALMLKVIRR